MHAGGSGADNAASTKLQTRMAMAAIQHASLSGDMELIRYVASEVLAKLPGATALNVEAAAA